ncbi:MAG: 2-hydroxyacid dehydrogenase [Mycobacterium sp.]
MSTPQVPQLVLVPDDLGVATLADSTSITTLRYQPGEPWPDAGLDATVVVVSHESSEATATRFAELPRLELIQTLTAGFEQWLPYLPDGVQLSNGRGAHGGSTAEWVVAALLFLYRDLAYFNHSQSEGQWRPADTDTLIGKRVLVLGAGDLGANLAARLTPFDTEVTLVGRTARAGVLALGEIGELLPHVDVVVSMLPADAATHHLIDAEFLSQLRDGAIVVNAGRGGAVDTDALTAELMSGRLRAALDVTDPEPLPEGHPLWTAPGLLLTPHVAGSTEGASERAWVIAREQIEEFLGGGRPANLVAGPGATDR